MMLTIQIENGVGRYSEKKVIFAENAPCTFAGFPSSYDGWRATLENGAHKTCFEIRDGAFTVPADHAILAEGVILMSVRKFVNGIAITALQVEPLAIVRDGEDNVLKPALDELLARLKEMEDRVKHLEDSRYGFDFNT